MTYEEIRQRCLNHARMHPSNPGDLVAVVAGAVKAGPEQLAEVATELAFYIETVTKVSPTQP